MNWAALSVVFFQGESCYNSTQVGAIKQMLRSSIANSKCGKLWSEINVLADLDHPNILRFLEAYEDGRAS